MGILFEPQFSVLNNCAFISKLVLLLFNDTVTTLRYKNLIDCCQIISLVHNVREVHVAEVSAALRGTALWQNSEVGTAQGCVSQRCVSFVQKCERSAAVTGDVSAA